MTVPKRAPPSTQPSSPASPLSTPQRPGIWQRLSNWWFGGFEPSITDDIRARARAHGDVVDDLAGVESLDALFLSVCGTRAVIDFVDSFFADVGGVAALEAEVRAAPRVAHVEDAAAVAALKRDAADNAARADDDVAVHVFLLCAVRAPLLGRAIEECFLVTGIDVQLLYAHGDPADEPGDDAGRDLDDDEDSALVVLADPFTPIEVLVERCRLGSGEARALEREGVAIIGQGPAGALRPLHDSLLALARLDGLPTVLRLRADAVPDVAPAWWRRRQTASSS